MSKKSAKKPGIDERAAPRLYLVTPRLGDIGEFGSRLEAALDAADTACVLLNFAGADPGAAKKIAQALAPLVQKRGAALLISGDPRLAARAGADGAHLRITGEGLEQAVADAVESLKPDRIVGAGGLKTRHDAMTAGEADIDYVMFGEPAADLWTPPMAELIEKVSWWSQLFNVPCVAFAPRLEDVAALARAGADFVALGDAVWNDPRGPAAAMRDAAAALNYAAGTP